MNDDSVEQKVIRFVCEMTHLPKNSVRLEQDLMKDLGVDGDDAVELMLAFRARFDVDISAFSFPEHFGQESAYVPFLLSLKWLFGRRPHFSPVTVSDLVRAAKSKSLSSIELRKRTN